MNQPTDTMRQTLDALLDQLWLENAGLVAERIYTLRQTQKQLEKHPFDMQSRKVAADTAHRLAGILGTFGLPQGTDIARVIEQKMYSSEPTASSEALELASMIDRLSELIDARSHQSVNAVGK